MSFIEDEEAFGVFDHQADDNEAMPLEDLPHDAEGGDLGETMNQEHGYNGDDGRLSLNQESSLLMKPKRSKPTTN